MRRWWELGGVGARGRYVVALPRGAGEANAAQIKKEGHYLAYQVRFVCEMIAP